MPNQFHSGDNTYGYDQNYPSNNYNNDQALEEAAGEDPYQGEYEQDAVEEQDPEEFKNESKYLSPLRLDGVSRLSSSDKKGGQKQNLPSFRKASPKASRGYISPFDKFIREQTEIY